MKQRLVKEALSFQDINTEIRRQLNPEPNAPERWWVEETFPTFVIVRSSETGKFYRIDYTVSGNTVTLGDRTEVELTYTPVAAESARGDGVGTPLAEVTWLKEAQVDPEGKVARVTIIRPGWSENRRYYSGAALKAAASLFEGAKAYADHPTTAEEAARPERSVRDLVGWYEGVRVDTDGRITADLHVLESAGWLRGILREAPHLVGVSINAFGRAREGTAEGRSGVIIESIVKVRSVDIVTEAAAGGRIEALVASKRTEEDPMDWKSIDLAALKANRPDLFEAARTEARNEVRESIAGVEKTLNELKENLGKVTEENKKLRADLAARDTRDKVTALVRESRLPEVAQARLIKRLAAGTYADEKALKEAVDAAVAEEREYLKAVSGDRIVRGMGAGPDPFAGAADALTEAQKVLDALLGVTEQKGGAN